MTTTTDIQAIRARDAVAMLDQRFLEDTAEAAIDNVSQRTLDRHALLELLTVERIIEALVVIGLPYVGAESNRAFWSAGHAAALLAALGVTEESSDDHR